MKRSLNMPYQESELKGKIREIRNSAEPVLDGITEELISYEVKPDHYKWLLEQAERVESLTKGIREVRKFMDEHSGAADNPRRLTMAETYEVFAKLTRLL
jgi:transglutaminase-like putative cysteine protease